MKHQQEKKKHPVNAHQFFPWTWQRNLRRFPSIYSVMVAAVVGGAEQELIKCPIQQQFPRFQGLRRGEFIYSSPRGRLATSADFRCAYKFANC